MASKNRAKSVDPLLTGMDPLLPLVIQHLPVGILLVNAWGKITHSNTKAESIFGYSRQELQGHSIEILLPDRFRSPHVGHREGFMTNPEARQLGVGRDLSARHKTGREIIVEIGLVPIPAPEGTVVLASVIDVTEKKQLELDFLHAIEMEQKRIGQDLHDDLCQQLTAITFLSEILEKKLSDKSLAEAAEAGEIHKLIAQAIVHARMLAKGFLPVELESNDLKAALKDLAATTEKLTHISCRTKLGEPVLIRDRTVATHLYRIAQEAVNNAIKHARAKQIAIKLSGSSGQVRLSITDDGVGIAQEAINNGGLGLSNMHSRADTINATLQIRRGDKGGTMVTCSLRSPATLVVRPAYRTGRPARPGHARKGRHGDFAPA